MLVRVCVCEHVCGGGGACSRSDDTTTVFVGWFSAERTHPLSVLQALKDVLSFLFLLLCSNSNSCTAVKHKHLARSHRCVDISALLNTRFSIFLKPHHQQRHQFSSLVPLPSTSLSPLHPPTSPLPPTALDSAHPFPGAGTF